MSLVLLDLDLRELRACSRPRPSTVGAEFTNGPVGSTAVALLGISTLESVPGGAGGRPLENT